MRMHPKQYGVPSYAVLAAVLLTAVCQTPVPAAEGATPPRPPSVFRSHYQVVYDYIERAHEYDWGRSRTRMRSTVNRLMDDLCRRNPLPPDLAAFLIGLYEDAGQDPVVRDYALQHLGGRLFILSSEEQRATITRSLSDAATADSGTMAGTALLGLKRGRGVDGGVSEAELTTLSASIAGNSNAKSDLARATALQVLAEVDRQAAKAVAADIRESDETVLRRSAAAVIREDSEESVIDPERIDGSSEPCEGCP